MKLSRPQRQWLYSTFAVLLLSGAAWCFLHRVSVDHDRGDGSRHLESWLLKIHGAAAMVFLVVFGALIPTHIKKGLARQRELLSGGTAIGVMVLLAVTGYALYYVGNDTVRAMASLIHTYGGMVSPAVLIVHVLGRRRRKASQRTIKCSNLLCRTPAGATTGAAAPGPLRRAQNQRESRWASTAQGGAAAGPVAAGTTSIGSRQSSSNPFSPAVRHAGTSARPAA